MTMTPGAYAMDPEGLNADTMNDDAGPAAGAPSSENDNDNDDNRGGGAGEQPHSTQDPKEPCSIVIVEDKPTDLTGEEGHRDPTASQEGQTEVSPNGDNNPSPVGGATEEEIPNDGVEEEEQPGGIPAGRLVASMVTFILSVVAISGCDFLWVNTSTRRRRLAYDWHVGIFQYHDYEYGECTHWSQLAWNSDSGRYDAAASWMARIFGVISAVLTGLIFLYWLLTALFVDLQPNTHWTLWPFVRVGFVLAFIAESITILSAKFGDLCMNFYMGSHYCVFGPVGWLAIVNALLLLLLSICHPKLPPRTKAMFPLKLSLPSGRRALIVPGVLAMTGITIGLSVGLTSGGKDQAWTQLGQALSVNDDRHYGRSVALSADGNVLAVASDHSARVYNYAKEREAWIQIGQDLEFETHRYLDVSLSADGRVLAAARCSQWPKRTLTEIWSCVQAYQLKKTDLGGEWTELDLDLHSFRMALSGTNVRNMGAFTMSSFSLSASGRRMAWSVRKDEHPIDEGFVQVYDWDDLGRNWTQVGWTLTYSTDSHSLLASLSSDGKVLAVGYKSYNAWMDHGLIGSGQIKVYQLNGTAWTQTGSIKPRYEPVDHLILSANGSRLATENGVYEADKEGQWTQLELNLDGRLDSFSSDGSTLSQSVRFARRAVQIFGWDAGKWQQIGEDKKEESPQTGFGEATALSHDGSILAIGAPGGDNGGYVTVHKQKESVE